MACQTTAKLNPFAPVFYPSYFYTVEEFEAGWWNLIQNDATYRNFWLQEMFLQWEQETENLEELELEFFAETNFSLESMNLVQPLVTSNRLEGKPKTASSVCLEKLLGTLSDEKHQFRGKTKSQTPLRKEMHKYPKVRSCYRIQQPKA